MVLSIGIIVYLLVEWWIEEGYDRLMNVLFDIDGLNDPKTIEWKESDVMKVILDDDLFEEVIN